MTVEIRAPRDADGLRRALADHGIPAVITYLPELRACAPGRYAEVERATSGLSSPTCLVTPDGAEDRLRVGGNLGLEGELLAVDLDRR